MHVHTCTHTHAPPTQLVHGYGFDVGLLPTRGLLSRFSRPKKGNLEEMQGKLEEMLMTIVQKFEVPPMELLKFVEYPFTVSSVAWGVDNSQNTVISFACGSIVKIDLPNSGFSPENLRGGKIAPVSPKFMSIS